MRRLYFLLPNEESCLVVVRELRQAGVGEHQLHLVAKDPHHQDELPMATELETTELGHGLGWGMGLGGAAGTLGGLLTVAFPPTGLVLGGGALLACALAGAGFGGFLSALLAKDMPRHELEGFQRGINAGLFLLLVDVPKERVEEFQRLIIQHHPEARIGVVRPTRYHGHGFGRVTHWGKSSSPAQGSEEE